MAGVCSFFCQGEEIALGTLSDGDSSLWPKAVFRDWTAWQSTQRSAITSMDRLPTGCSAKLLGLPERSDIARSGWSEFRWADSGRFSMSELTLAK